MLLAFECFPFLLPFPGVEETLEEEGCDVVFVVRDVVVKERPSKGFPLQLSCKSFPLLLAASLALPLVFTLTLRLFSSSCSGISGRTG